MRNKIQIEVGIKLAVFTIEATQVKEELPTPKEQRWKTSDDGVIQEVSQQTMIQPRE
jgi:hypothetical protein